MPQEVYSEMEQSFKSGGKYMVSASIKASKFTVKEFNKLCKWIHDRLRGKNQTKIGKQSLKSLLSHGDRIVELGVEAPKPEEAGKIDVQRDGLTWDKGMIKGFEKYADKYGVNYSILKEKGEGGETTYHVFFEAKDSTVVDKCLGDYLKDRVKQNSRRSLLDRFKFHQKEVINRTEHEHSKDDKIKDKVPHHEER